MNGLIDYITQRPWLDTLTTQQVLADDAYRVVVHPQLRLVRDSGPAPKFTDSEVIRLGLILETVSHGQEELGYAFVSQDLGAEFPQLLDLGRLNA